MFVSRMRGRGRRALLLSAVAIGAANIVGAPPHSALAAGTCAPAFEDSAADAPALPGTSIQATSLDIVRGDFGLTPDEGSLRTVLTISDMTAPVPVGSTAVNYISYWTFGGATRALDAVVTPTGVTYEYGTLTFAAAGQPGSTVQFTADPANSSWARGTITTGPDGQVEVDMPLWAAGLTFNDELTGVGGLTATGPTSGATVSDQDGAPSAPSNPYSVGQATCISPQTAPAWAATEAGVGSGPGNPGTVAADTAKGEVISTGFTSSGSYPQPTHDVFEMFAYAAGTGSRFWAVSYDEPTTGGFGPASPVLSADGATVFVIGDGAAGAEMIRAYDAGSGALRWTRSLSPAAGASFVSRVMRATGTAVVIANGVKDGAGSTTWLTTALKPATGARLWSARLAGVADGQSQTPADLAFPPDGTSVLVGGVTDPTANDGEPTVVRYRLTSGTQEALVRQPQSPALSSQQASAFAMSADGGTAVLAITGATATNPAAVQVTAYDLGTGSTRWSTAQAPWGVVRLLAGADGSSAYLVTLGSSGPDETGTITAFGSGGQVRWTVTGETLFYDAALSADGTQLAAAGGLFSRGGNNGSALAVYATADGTAQRVLTYSNNTPNPSAAGRWMGVAWDGTAIAVSGFLYPSQLATLSYALG